MKDTENFARLFRRNAPCGIHSIALVREPGGPSSSSRGFLDETSLKAARDVIAGLKSRQLLRNVTHHPRFLSSQSRERYLTTIRSFP